MNKKLLVAALGILIIIGAGMTYLWFQKNTQTEPGKDVAENSKKAPDPQVESLSGTKGTYVDYTQDTFTSTKGTKLLFFHASWCPQCRDLDKSIKASQLPDNVTIFKVDYDTNQSLRAKYGVTLQTTVVKTDEKGDKVSSYVAYDEPTFQSVERALLP